MWMGTAQLPIERPPSGPSRLGRWPLSLLVLSALSALVGCTDTPVQGTYTVSIRLEQARSPIEATMILTSQFLEGTDPFYGADAKDDEVVGDPNSCLIIPSNDPKDDAPRTVSYFETRLQAGEFRVPTTIFKTPSERITITELGFFANSLGGELEFRSEGEVRGGMIHGDRVGEPAASRCSDALAKFYERLESLQETAQDGTTS